MRRFFVNGSLTLKFRLRSTVARLKFKKFGGSLFQLEERVV